MRDACGSFLGWSLVESMRKGLGKLRHTQMGAGRDKSRDLTSRPACLLRDLAKSQPHLPAVFSFPALKDIRSHHLSRARYKVACMESSQIESG